ncbi:hypothetical protein FMEAI12_2460001 [Parafrankia sp. Ea1.12]|nr:hypothetical protein FMEAI12_2460001 [Parafrankia sp. Ea1.12]
MLINPKVTGARRRAALLTAAKAGTDLDPDEAHLARVVGACHDDCVSRRWTRIDLPD